MTKYTQFPIHLLVTYLSKSNVRGQDLTFLSPITVRELRSFLASTEKRGNQEYIKLKDAVWRNFSFPSMCVALGR